MRTHCWYFRQDSLFLLTPQSIVECHGDHSRVESPHSLHSELRNAWGVEQSVPTLLHLLLSEPAGEIDAQVDSCEVIGLLYSTDQHQVIGGTPTPKVLDTCCGLEAGELDSNVRGNRGLKGSELTENVVDFFPIDLVTY